MIGSSALRSAMRAGVVKHRLRAPVCMQGAGGVVAGMDGRPMLTARAAGEIGEQPNQNRMENVAFTDDKKRKCGQYCAAEIASRMQPGTWVRTSSRKVPAPSKADTEVHAPCETQVLQMEGLEDCVGVPRAAAHRVASPPGLLGSTTGRPRIEVALFWPTHVDATRVEASPQPATWLLAGQGHTMPSVVLHSKHPAL